MPLVFDDRAPATLGADADDLTLAQAVARLMREKLDLPFPSDTKIYLYVNQGTYAEGLIRDGGLKKDDAWDGARFSGGASSKRGMFLRADYLARSPLLDRVALIAHELAHVSQREMRQGNQRAPRRWIVEGHADWVKFQILELLSIRSYSESRDEIRRSILHSRTPVRLFPGLAALVSGGQWTKAANQLGIPATYGQAFLAVDWLVERYGIAKLHEFLRRFALNTDTREHWRSVFPIPDEEFAREFRARLEALE